MPRSAFAKICTSGLTSCAVVLATVAAPAAPALARSGDHTYELTCDASNGGAYNGGGRFCAAPNRKVKLVEDYSGRCDKGDTWKRDERGIYVRGGCAGRFRVTENIYDQAGNTYPADHYPSDNDPNNYPEDGGYYGRGIDKTGVVLVGAALGAGLLWVIKNAEKSRKNAGSAGDGKDWVDPDSGEKLPQRDSAEREAFKICDAEVQREVAEKGGRNLALKKLIMVAPHPDKPATWNVLADYTADFNDKNVKRRIACEVADGQVMKYSKE